MLLSFVFHKFLAGAGVRFAGVGDRNYGFVMNVNVNDEEQWFGPEVCGLSPRLRSYGGLLEKEGLQSKNNS